MSNKFTLSIVLLVTLSANPASAELINEELVCRAPDVTLTAHEYLRSLSFDLRGQPPTMDEYYATDAVNGVPENLIDEWIESPEFQEQAVRFHRSLIWHNISNQRLFNRRAQFDRTPSKLFYRRIQATTLRGDRIPCLDEPVSYTEDGEIAVTQSVQEDGDIVFQEGWVEVSPYWAPDTVIKVCAMDAQDSAVGKKGNDCRTTAGFNDKSCGCGPNLRWCSYKTEGAIRSAIEEDLNKRVRWILENNRPYTDLLTQTPAFINGPLAHFMRYQTAMKQDVGLVPLPVAKEQLPELTHMDKDSWVSIALGSQHSGILTSPAFLWRFQTNRARANKYYATFLCQPFIPPPGGLGESSDADALENDLQIRNGCKYCHAMLEPAGSYWGRWPQLGAGFLTDNNYPAFSDECEKCAFNGGCSSYCSKNYITKAMGPDDAQYFGWLKPYLYRRTEHKINVQEGPQLLVKKTMVDHRLPTCMARRMSTWLLGRNVLPEEEGWLAGVAQQFVMNGYNFKALVKAVVSSELYRSVR